MISLAHELFMSEHYPVTLMQKNKNRIFKIDVHVYVRLFFLTLFLCFICLPNVLFVAIVYWSD